VLAVISPRPDPDQLLARIQEEEQQHKRGQLKIFLGYAAGVGKTYAMLEAAHQRKAEGIEVVVGYVETHRRAETEAMAADLEIIPRKKIQYRGIDLPEMDVDAVLARRPQLALVDELAHTNVPGARHLKRYQDVEELLDAGIDVYTTLNIQHLESLNDVVAQITGIKVHETIPDRVLDNVSEIELIDLPPDELLVRLKEGKVYIPEQAARAIEKFFRKGNLTALRELALRRTAERVDDQMRAYMQTQAIPGPWPAAERLMVCISPSPLAERLVRSARRLAGELNAEWLAIYVETPGHSRLPQEKRDRIARNLRLAEELGAKTLTLPGQSVAETIINYARQHNVTKVIVGKPLRPRWDELLRGSVVDRLARQSGSIDVYIISGEPSPATVPEDVPWRPHHPLRRYLWGALLVVVATAISSLFHLRISPTNLVMIYLLSVIIAATYLGSGPAILVSILSVLAFDFFFVPPFLTFAVSDTEYILTFFGLLVVGIVISQLTARVREHADAAERREANTSTLYALSRDLAAADSLNEILKAIMIHVGQAFGREAMIFLPDPSREGMLEPYTNNPDLTPDENELAVAVWAFQHGQPAGRGTDTLSAAEARYLPLKTSQGVVGVLGVRPGGRGVQLLPEQRRLLEAFASQAALAIERAQLADQARQAQLLQATEKLQTALLNSISHDLRTPLVTITGALSSLEEDGVVMDEEIRRSLVVTAREEADRLNRLVGNLLNMTRLEAGVMRVVKEPVEIQDAIGAALEQVGDRLDGRSVVIDAPEDLPFVPLDFVLIVQVLVNLLDNAIKYSPPSSPIELQVSQSQDIVQVEVCDRGSGIPPEDLERVFEKFYRVHQPGNVTGTGLGLSICRGIIEAHGGHIWARNRFDGGACIRFTLPKQESEGSSKEKRLGMDRRT
jgi:two-component system sensor histidine kinase KdpD